MALEQAYLLNRFAAYVPAGMMYALGRDVVARDGGPRLEPGEVQLRPDKRPRPLVLRVNEGDCLEVRFTNLLSRVQDEEGGIPRENGARLPAHVGARAGTVSSGALVPTPKVSMDAPRTRTASFHVTGLELVPIPSAQCPRNVACGGDGSNVGLPGQQGLVFNPETGQVVRDQYDQGSLAKPGQTVVTRWRAKREGAYFAYSAAAPVGGEGDGGQIGLGLFASINVEPAGSRWYRSQVTFAELQSVKGAAPRQPYAALDYDREHIVAGRRQPILGMLDSGDNIVHSDLNAIVVLNERPAGRRESEACTGAADGTSCGRSFREFTVIFHDEVHAQQAFAELEDENNPLHFIKDGMGINYGVSSMGSLVLSTPKFGKNVGPAAQCPECRAEEFFLSSWANGDPALILEYDAAGTQAVGARYPDDPSNVHHSYLGDPVRFRNLHAGPKETHVFHLHAHQWVQDSSDPNAHYLDSQTISPGATFSYNIEFGGAGNRNYTPGDSIFHCHLYPHFAQGMWELWRVHDAFVDGRPGFFDASKPIGPDNEPGMLNLPDAEVAQGTASPAIVPIPGTPLAPMPTAEFRGYPFYIPGSAGHRPPQPALDMDVDPTWTDMATEPAPEQVVNGGLPRHIVAGGTLNTGPGVIENALGKGGDAAQVIAQRVARQDPAALTTLAAEWEQLTIRKLQHTGEPAERRAMAFHEGALTTANLHPVTIPASTQRHPGWWVSDRGYRTDNAATTSIQAPRPAQDLFYVNARPRAPGAPFANPCPDGVPERGYRAAFIQTELTYNKHGWFDPQGRIIVLENDIKDVIDANTRSRPPEPLFFRANSGECIVYKSSNFMPSALNVDDFQIYTPTDTIGQHIHLVKFDVTSSDGSGNGFNYEDATFSPDEVRERIFAYNRTLPSGSADRLAPKAHPLFLPRGDIYEAARRWPQNAGYAVLLARGQCPDQNGQSDEDYARDLTANHPLCGAQRTTQRWWADPILNRASNHDNTLRTVFTHDHMGPSSHQQHGLYAGLVIEPANSVWTQIGASVTPNDLLAAQQPDALNCGEAHGSALRSALCDKLIGGSNLAIRSPPLRPEVARIEGGLEARAPLRLQTDGGPTATRANIIAPSCIGDSDSNPLQPKSSRNRPGSRACPEGKQAHDTRREFALAIADFGIAYNTALEPINPEPRGDSMLRDNTSLRFGRRHVATTPARPLGISSEDPGSQYFNYRHEPAALRLSESSWNAQIGGWDYRQATKRADGVTPCGPANQDCLGDPANAFSTSVHAKRDKDLATEPWTPAATKLTTDLLAGTAAEGKLGIVLRGVEAWRRDFNCALYPTGLLPEADDAADPLPAGRCRRGIERLEPWRVFGDPATPILPAYEGDAVQIRLIQGAQEAQHIFTMNGVKWHRLPGSNGPRDANRSGFTNAQPVGISEHFEFDLLVNPLGSPSTDYLYFGSSVDQLWDGLWGILRSYKRPSGGDPARTVATSASPAVPLGASSFLASISGEQPPRLGTDRIDLCSEAEAQRPQSRDLFFDVSALRVCDLYGDCGSASRSGIEYSARLGIRDQKALIYVLNQEKVCKSGTGCDGEADQASRTANRTILRRLRLQFALGRPVEPLVLRAAAGQCLHITLRNHLPALLDDGPPPGPDNAAGEVEERNAYHNFLPMITDGFNMNQFRMSSSVGLSAPRVAQHPLWGDGSNVGLNAAVRSADDPPEARSLPRQGSLVPPCLGSVALDGSEEARCKTQYVWSATDLSPDRASSGKPVEFGALPLRSFGDPFKHPAHGLIGALVIGPRGSRVCPNNRFARRLNVPMSGDTAIPGGLSAEICRADGSRYIDHVLIMQDAVNATRGGMPVPNLSGAEEPDDYGVKAINYKTEPLWGRAGNDPSIPFDDRGNMDYGSVLSSAVIADDGGVRCRAGISPLFTRRNPCDPETPVLEARAGETVRLNFVHPGGHTRQQGLALSGHDWNPYPWSDDSRVLDPAKGSSIRQGVFNGFGPMMGVTLELKAGGERRVAMDYLLRGQASFLFDGGMWGILRVRPAAR